MILSRRGDTEGAVKKSKWELEHIFLRQVRCNSTVEKTHRIKNILTYKLQLKIRRMRRRHYFGP